MKKLIFILLVALFFVHLSSCESPNAQCFDPNLCPHKVQSEQAEKQQRRWS